ncbi:hypothetical protein C1H76_5894 [Elsinoe australis]|uniref:Uncharacterized protein n=1 Tax=Elsinoe australis TaxID=40998 RepID=A0A4U7AYK3_9PEZI|nr:hypothetical protein C1H76_5894 [Elsinoe australis]
MATTPVSPVSQAFGHHEDYARRLVEGTPTPPTLFSRRHHIQSHLRLLTDNDEDHVLRGSRSATRSASSTLPFDKLRMPLDTHSLYPTPVLGEIDPNNQRMRAVAAVSSHSPTASLKKKKAERILKAHGSPPGIRVTAGGRIVPSEQSPLCSPRYGYSAAQKNGGMIKFAPGYPPPPKTFPNYAKTLPNGWVLQDPSGKLVQVVDGRFLIINEVNSIPQLYITAPNVTNMAWSQFQEANAKSASQGPTKTDALRKTSNIKDPSVPSAADQIAALEKQYQKLEAERRSLDKTEVLKRNELTGTAYSQLVQKRRELVERQDKLRRSIKALKETQHASGGATDTAKPSSEMHAPQFTMPSPFLLPGHFPVDPNMAGVRMPMMLPAGPGEVPVIVPQGFYPGGLPQFLPMGPFMPSMVPIGTPSVHSAGSPVPTFSDVHHPSAPAFVNSMSARSSENDKDSGHGLHPSAAGMRSALNPMSPAYEPSGSKVNTPEKKRPSPLTNELDSSVIISAPSGVILKESGSQGGKSTTHSSEASYATADFFPHNPRDYSLNKDAYPAKHHIDPMARTSMTTHQSTSEEAIAQPEMERHNANWNPTIPDQAFRKVSAGERSTAKSSDKEAVDQSQAPREFRPAEQSDERSLGYKAGLIRAAIGTDKSKEWLDGYCKGLLESAQPQQPVSFDVQPDKLVVRLPSVTRKAAPAPAAITVNASPPQSDQNRSLPRKVDLSGLQHFINSPANENAILSPDPEGPSVDAIQGKSLGSWSKENSAQGPDSIISQSHHGNEAAKRFPSTGPVQVDAEHKVATSDFAQTRVEPAELTSGHRTFSSQTQPAKGLSGSYFQRAYGAHRVLSSPMDWRSATSVAQVAGLASGYFAQFDGTFADLATYRDMPPLTRCVSQTGTSSKPSSKAPAGNDSYAATKFKEASMPQEDPPSPGKASDTSSPKKSVSPAKAKFAAIAGKAGIKVRTDRPQSKESNELEPMSPQERRRWRNVWKKRNTATD